MCTRWKEPQSESRQEHAGSHSQAPLLSKQQLQQRAEVAGADSINAELTKPVEDYLVYRTPRQEPKEERHQKLHQHQQRQHTVSWRREHTCGGIKYEEEGVTRYEYYI